MQLEQIFPRSARGRQARSAAFLAVLLILFTGLALLAHSIRLLHLDEGITRQIQHFRSPRLDLAAEAVTLFGSTGTLLIFGGWLAVSFTRAKRKRLALFCLLALLGLPLNWLIKQIVDRSRPAQGMAQIVLHATGLSFPSGHSMGSTMFYGFLAFLLWTQARQANRQRAIAAGLVLQIVLISLSRIYLGVHWFSDVLGGWLAGLFFLILLVEAYRIWGIETPAGEHERAHRP